MKAGQFVLYSIIEYHMRKILYIKTRLTYDIAYYKNIIKSLYTFIQQTIKSEHARCGQLPLFTFLIILFIQSLFKEY